MNRPWIHYVALGAFVVIGLAWGLVRCGVIGTLPTRMPVRPDSDPSALIEELPVDGVQGFPERYFAGSGRIVGCLKQHPDGGVPTGTTVMLASDPAKKVTVDARGCFALASVPAAFGAALRIEVPGGTVAGVADIPVRADETTDVGSLWVGGSATLAGTISDPDGKPRAGAVVTLFSAQWVALRASSVSALPFHMRPQALRRATTAADGTYSLEGVSRGRVIVVVRSAGHAPLWGVIDVSPDDEGRQRFDATLEAGYPLSGFVLGVEGEPIEGASVVVVSEGDAGESVLTARHALTDAKGRFRFTTVRRPDERLFVFSGTQLFTWADPLLNGMVVRLR